MKPKPSDTELRTFYAGIRNGDSSDQVRRILGVSKRQLRCWEERGKKAKKKQRRGFELDKDEKACLKLLQLKTAADRRRRGW